MSGRKDHLYYYAYAANQFYVSHSTIPNMIDTNERSSPSLYRILAFHRVVQMFEDRELHFSHPSSWEDPFETRLRHSAANRVFAQCWCKKGVSDAMWRIYSPDTLGVRIRTTRKKLQAALCASGEQSDVGVKIKQVRYLPEKSLTYELEAIADELAQRFLFKNACSPLFMKRLAFRHEAEVRAVIYVCGQQAVDVAKGFKLSVDPHALIQSILVDPRAPDEFVRAYRYYLCDKLGFAGRVAKSELYADREPLEVI